MGKMLIKDCKTFIEVGDTVETNSDLHVTSSHNRIGEIEAILTDGFIMRVNLAEYHYKWKVCFDCSEECWINILKKKGVKMGKIVGKESFSSSGSVKSTKKEEKVVEKVLKEETPSIISKIEAEKKYEMTKKEKIKKISEARKEMKLIGLEQEEKALELGIENNFPVLLIGETGIGKTYVLQHLAKKHEKKVVRISLNGEIGINELLGKWLVKEGSTFWQDGVLVECMRKGYWVILDEINAALPEVLFCLNSLLDDSRSIVIAEKDGELVKPHGDFRLFATMNPPGEYTGTKDLNKALLSRFAIVLYLKEYVPEQELEIVKYQSCVGEVSARIMIDIANAIRKEKEKQEIWYTCSTRDVVNWARLFSSNGNTLEETFRFSILNKASMEDWEVIEKAVKESCEIDFEWTWKHKRIEKLTELLKIDIEKLKNKRKALKSAVDELVSKAEQVRGVI